MNVEAPTRVHVTTTDMSLELLLGPQLELKGRRVPVAAAGGAC